MECRDNRDLRLRLFILLSVEFLLTTLNDILRTYNAELLAPFKKIG